MRRKIIKYPGGSWRFADDDTIVNAYEAIANSPNLPLPEEISLLVTTENARRRILSHYERIIHNKPYNLPQQEK